MRLLKHEEEGESKHTIRRVVDGNRALGMFSESKQKFRCLVEGAGVAIGISDKKGHFTYVNKALVDLMGYSIPEMVGSPFKDFLHPDDRGRIMRLFLKAFLFRTQPQNFEFRAIRKDGQVLHLMSQPTRLTINGKTVGFQAIIINITGRKKIEKALQESEERYKELTESINDVFFAMDKELRYTYWNKASEKLTGISAKDAIGKSLTEVFPDIKGTNVEQMYLGTLRTQQSQNFVNRYQIGDKDFVFEINTYPTEDGLSVFVKDITERKKAEEELIRLSSAVKMSTDSIVISDINGKILDVNEATLKMYGSDDKEDLIGKNSFNLIAPEDRETALAGSREVLEKGYLKSREYQILTKDGGRIPVEMSIAILKDTDGKPKGFVGISRDTTERKKMEEALKRQRDIAITLSGARNLIEALNRLFDNLLEIEEFDCVGFYLVDNDTGALDMIIHRGLPDGFVEKVGHLDADSPYTKVVMEGKPIYQKTSDFPPVIRKDLQSDGILTAAAIPIMYKGEVIGNLNMASHTHDEISSSTRQVLESVSAQIGEAIVRAKIEEKLRESEEKFRNLAEQSPNMIFINQKGRVVYANKRCEEIMGYKKEEFYSPDFDFLTLSPPESTDLLKTSFSRHMKDETVAPYEYRLITKEGKKIETILTTKLIRYKGEIAILGILTDITHRKQMENELRLYSEHLEELVEERTKELKESQEQLLKSEKLATIGELATMVGHDLRNPLQSIENATYYLNNELPHLPISQKAIEMLQIINNSVNYADKIIKDLHDFSTTKKPILKKTNINTIVKETLSQAETPENVKLTTELGHLPQIEADKDMIKRILLNLTVNGIQAMKEKGGTLKVSTKKTKNFVEINFEDTGIGMPKENIEKLFTPFFTTKAKGMGMGLPICKKFVESHGGNIEAESEEGKGTTFTVKLPIQ